MSGPDAHVPVTALYAGLLGLLMVVLGITVTRQRFVLGASLATDTSPRLHEAVRRFGNLAEWVPFILLLMLIAELNGLAQRWLHLIGVLLLAARLLHMVGVRQDRIPQPLRAAGASLTYALTAALCAIVIAQAAGAL